MHTRIRISEMLIASFLAVICSSAAQGTSGQPGTLDPFWATGSPLGVGKVVTQIGNGADDAAAMLLQPDGKVVVAGTCDGVSNRDFCALRYDPSGVLDPSFGNGGKVITSMGSLDDFATSVALQPDGKVLVVGYCQSGGVHYDFCALRYNTNGTLDTTFGGLGTGKVITTLGALPRAGIDSDNASAVIVQSDGKIIVAGTCTFGSTNIQFCALRYNNNGTLDTTFGSAGSGKVFTAVGTGGIDTAAAMTLQPDGKVLVAGSCASTLPTTLFCVVRYNADGTLDLSFNFSGKVTSSVGSSSAVASAIALQPDVKIVLAGYCRGATGTDDFCVVRYVGDGSLDNRFGSGGKAVTAVGPLHDHAAGIAIQPDGKILVSGDCNPLASDTLNSVFCAARLSPNGSLDSDFGSAGKVLTDFDGHDFGKAMALQPDGRILLAGTCSPATHDFCAARYDGGPFGYQNCKLDIDGDGRVLATTDMLIATRIAVGMTGNAVVNGITFSGTATRNTWPLIRDYLVTQCGMSLLQ